MADRLKLEGLTEIADAIRSTDVAKARIAEINAAANEIKSNTSADLNSKAEQIVEIGQQTVESIPADYTVMERDVRTLKDTITYKADVDGYYPEMSVGLSENLISPDGVIDEEPYIFRTTAGSQSVTDGNAEIQKIKGKTIVWNQLAEGSNYEGNGITIVRNNGSMTINGTCSKQTIFIISGTNELNTPGHKYLIKGNYELTHSGSLNRDIRINQDAIGLPYGTDGVFEMRDIAGKNNHWYILIYEGVEIQNVTFTPQIHDLTLMFGAGNEPTAEQFERMFPESYYPYEMSRMVNVNVDAIKTVGFNLLNTRRREVIMSDSGPADQKEFSEDHYYVGLGVTGYARSRYVASWRVTDNEVSVASTNTNSAYGVAFPVRCMPNTSYYMKATHNDPEGIRITFLFYDKEGNLQTRGSVTSQISVTAPPNAYWLVYLVTPNALNHKITITDPVVNLQWSGYRNGDYEPYWEQVKDLSWINEIRDDDGKLLFPDGLHGFPWGNDEVTASKAIRRVHTFTFTRDNIDSINIATTWLPTVVISPSIGKGLYPCNPYIYPHVGRASTGFNLRYTNESGYIGFQIEEIGMDSSATLEEIRDYLVNKHVTFVYVVRQDYEQEVVFNESYSLLYRISDFGTEQFLSTSASIPQSAPVPHETFYMNNLRDAIRRIPSEYQSNDSMDNLTDALESAFGIIINKTWDEVTKAWKYQITNNVATRRGW